MGVGRLPKITAALVDGGLDETTPVALVRWGTRPDQQTVRGTLADIADRVEAAGLKPPAIIVVGAVAGLADEGLDWFTARPLFGRRIVVTRTRHQASALSRQLADLGAEALEAPTIALEPPESFERVDQLVAKIGSFDWLVLTSTNGVAALAERMDHLGLDGRALAGVKVAAIGDATAEAVREQLGLRADLVPTRFVAESLATELLAEEADPADARFLLLRADIARPALRERLEEAGGHVEEAAIYRTVPPANLPGPVLEGLGAGTIDWITFTSSSTARNLVDLLDGDIERLQSAKLASIGPITSRTLRELGLEPDTEATVSNIDGLVAAIVAAEKR